MSVEVRPTWKEDGQIRDCMEYGLLQTACFTVQGGIKHIQLQLHS